MFEKLRISYKDLEASKLQKFMLKTEFDQILNLEDRLCYHGLGSIISSMKMVVIEESAINEMKEE